MAKKDKKAMKRQLLGTLDGLREHGIDLAETPALFIWSYEEEPWIEFKLMITETDQAALPLEEPLH